MKLAIRYQGKEWCEQFTAVLEIDDKFGEMFKEQFLQLEVARAIDTVLHDLSHPKLTAVMRHVNGAIREVKNAIVEGILELEELEKC